MGVSGGGMRLAVRGVPKVTLYTILPLPILYGVWHTQEGSVGGHILRNGRAIVLQ